MQPVKYQVFEKETTFWLFQQEFFGGGDETQYFTIFFNLPKLRFSYCKLKRILAAAGTKLFPTAMEWRLEKSQKEQFCPSHSTN